MLEQRTIHHEPPRLLDGHGRHLRYLRLSVTDRCNLRCAYCLPNGCPRGSGEAPLSLPEIRRLVRAFDELGFHKVRLTGGEPTLRRDLLEIVAAVAASPGVHHVGLTTNGLRLAALAADLARAGLNCLNVSIDSLDPARFEAITSHPGLDQVLAGVEAALAAGIPRIKVNAVLLSTTDDAEVDRFLAWARDMPVTVRFIELMETAGDPAYFLRHHVPAAEIERRLAERGWRRLPRREGDGPATDYGLAGHRGRIGVIAPYRRGFCQDCNRLRVSAAGELKLCLFSERTIPLRQLLQSNGQHEALVAAIEAAVGAKPATHQLAARRVDGLRNMAVIGG